MEQHASDIQTPAIQPSDRQLGAAIESLLFVSGRPLQRAELRKLLGIDDARLAEVLQTLENDLERQERGIRLQRLGEQVQLVTAPEYAHYVASLLGLPMTARLTPASLETLAVIAYRQPVGRVEVDEIRGVDSGAVIDKLVERGLVEVSSRGEGMGRPLLYGTTPQFMEILGLKSLDQLPRLEELSVALRPPLPAEPE